MTIEPLLSLPLSILTVACKIDEIPQPLLLIKQFILSFWQHLYDNVFKSHSNTNLRARTLTSQHSWIILSSFFVNVSTLLTNTTRYRTRDPFSFFYFYQFSIPQPPLQLLKNKAQNEWYIWELWYTGKIATYQLK